MNDDARDKYYRRKYGITLDDYNAILKKQNYSCAICKKPETAFKKRLSVEHNHRTGQVRGAACFYCNKWIISRHSKKTAKALWDYLRLNDKEKMK